MTNLVFLEDEPLFNYGFAADKLSLNCDLTVILEVTLACIFCNPIVFTKLARVEGEAGVGSAHSYEDAHLCMVYGTENPVKSNCCCSLSDDIVGTLS